MVPDEDSLHGGEGHVNRLDSAVSWAIGIGVACGPWSPSCWEMPPVGVQNLDKRFLESV
jgi:hypothetical protein